MIKNFKENSFSIHSDDWIHFLSLEFRVGQPVVHKEHGIGLYSGMIVLEVNKIKSEYLVLIYADNTKLYVPISSFNLISPYIGSIGEKVPLHRLGSKKVWERTKKKAAKTIRDTAADLLNIYSKRLSTIGHIFKYDKKKYQLFCDSFPFTTTPDQEKAINDVINDMCKPTAMDRLICGDVGFGKTEVAIRAAFIAVENKKQVAILVPTNLLAQQHFDTFRHRFSDWSINVEMLSSFCDAKEKFKIIKKTKSGHTNILIGTHQLLQNEIIWKKLGLLIIDEEHRFGVFQKEHIKSLYSNIDILTLTATPIPRTLNMAMNGIRDLSIITTPPSNRLAVKTFIREYDKSLVRKVILREILRGGQVYYLYNNIKNIQNKADQLSELIPEACIAVGHGKMNKNILENLMNDFRCQKFNVLVCTTIIEIGIDIPTVNTIIIENADHFGLAQLYQLCGRVGRSYHQAYAWLLISNSKKTTSYAKQRLDALSSVGNSGVGLALSMHDLSIRGSGTLLGKEQSGSINTIGYAFYMELLENSINAIKSGKTDFSVITDCETKIELKIPSLLPDSFISDVNIRLSFYHRITAAKTKIDLQKIKIELINKFGLLPEEALNLFDIAELKQLTKKLGITKLESNEKGGIIEFSNDHKIDPIWLINLIKNYPKTFYLDSSSRLKFVKDLSKQKQRINWIKNLIHQMQEYSTKE